MAKKEHRARETPSADGAAAPSVGETLRSFVLLVRDVDAAAQKLQAAMERRETPVVTTPFQGENGSPAHIEAVFDDSDGLFTVRVFTAGTVLRGDALETADAATAAELAQDDRRALGLPDDVSNAAFLAAIERELERDPLRGMFFARAFPEGDLSKPPHYDTAREGRSTDKQGEYRFEPSTESLAIDLGCLFHPDGSPGSRCLVGGFTPERIYRLNLAAGSIELMLDEAADEGTGFAPYAPSDEELKILRSQVNDFQRALLFAIDQCSPR